MINKMLQLNSRSGHYVFVLVLFAGLVCSFVDCFAVGKPVTSLTLIPPSPVSDNIELDVRGGVWNRSSLGKTYQVTVFLDEEKSSAILYEERIEIDAGSSGCIKFEWPTSNYVGKHEMIFVVKSGSDVWRTSRSLEIVDTDKRSTGSIDGAWFEFYHWSEAEGRLWNSEIVKLTDEQWKELVSGMHDIGMDLVIIQDTYHNPDRYVGKHTMEKDGFVGHPYYPSSIYSKHPMIAANDPLEAVLAEADKHEMNVMVGVGGYAWFDFTQGSLEWHKTVAEELWQKYGHHRSFYGWYVSEEIAGNLGTDDLRREQIVEFFREFKKYVTKLAPDKPVMLASNCHSVGQSNGYYPKLLENLDILCPFGFHRMPAGDYTGEEAARILQDYCDEAGSHLWMDMEVFLFGAKRELYPRPIEGVIDDFKRFPDFEKICCYSYTGLMNSPRQSRAPGGRATVRLYNEYAKYLAEGVPEYTVKHSGVGKSVELRSMSSPRYSKGNLTDGMRASRDFRSGQWLGFENRDFDAVIDMGRAMPIEKVQVRFLEFKTAAIVLPAQVEFCFSVDGRDYQKAVTVKHEMAGDEFISFVHVFEAKNLDRKARYVRVRGESVDQWLFVDEIIVNPIQKPLKER